MFLTTKTYQEGLYMTQVLFTLNSEEIEDIIEQSVTEDVSKNVLTTVFTNWWKTSERNIFKLKTMNDLKADGLNEIATTNEI